MEALTVPAFWKDFDSKAGEFNQTIISRTERGNYILSAMYFSSTPFGGKSARIYAQYYEPKDNPDAPLILIFDDFLHDLNFDLPHLMNGEFAALRVDFEGESDLKERFTIYPREYKKCNVLLFPDELSTVPDDLYASSRYVSTAIALRSLAFAEIVLGYKREKIAAIGVGEGAEISFRLCALEKLGAGVGLYGGSILYGDSAVNDMVAYKSALEVSSYARFMETPFLEQITSNSQTNSLDYISDMMLSVKNPDSRFSIMERANRYLAPKQRRNVPYFLKYHLLGEGQPIPKSPQISVKTADNKLFFQVSYDASIEVESCELFVSQAMSKSAYRNWSGVALKEADGVLMGQVAVFDVTKTVYAFVNVKYRGYVSISSPELRIIPSALGIIADPVTQNRLVYDSDMGLDDWLVLNDYEMDETVKLDMVEGPYGIEGVCSKTFSLATFKPGDPRYIGYEGRTLQIRLYSEIHQQIEFIIKQKSGADTRADFVSYSCFKTVGPFDDWATLNFNVSDFKSELGNLSGWKDIAMLEIVARGGEAGIGKVLVNTIIWL